MKLTSLSILSDYIDNIRKWAYKDVYHIQNNVLNKNPYTSDFIHNYCFDKKKKLNKFFIFKKILMFYVKSTVSYCLFFVNYLTFKILGKKSDVDFEHEVYIIDIFFLVDTIIKEGVYRDGYFSGLYEVLEKYNKEYVFLPRLHGVDKSPFKFNKLLRILNKDTSNKFILEYELLSLVDILKILAFILSYPIKQFELIQHEDSDLDKIFNYELFNSLPNTSFEAYTRYLVGRNISKRLSGDSKVFSWQEFQNLEKTFYRAIRESNNRIVIYGCEFLIKYKSYLGMHITDTDVELLITPHKTLLNGPYNYSKSSKHNFKNGVSLRYKGIFRFVVEHNIEPVLLALLSSNVIESQNVLKTIEGVDDLRIKVHPITNEKGFDSFKKVNWNYVYGDLYQLFKNTNIVFVSPMSGTALEAVACGVSVIIILNSDKLSINPLVHVGYGKIWDAVLDKIELESKVSALLEFRANNLCEIHSISNWYKDNFFIEPTENNIAKVFEL